MQNIYLKGYMRNKLVFLGLLLLISCIFLATSANGNQLPDSSAINLDLPRISLETKPFISPASFSIQYTPHAPIYINGNMSATADAEGWAGNGTVSNPYLIEGWNITSSTSTLIHIENTVAYFIIRDNSLNGVASDYMGIFLQSVINGKIESNTIHSGKWGIYLNSSSNNILSDNTAYNHKDCGILLRTESDANTVTKNICYQNGLNGIYLDDVNNNIVRNNTCFNNGVYGVSLSGSSRNVVSQNQVYDNEYGIELYVCSANTITENICYQNYHGILNEGCFNNVIFNNTVFSNMRFGIVLSNSFDCLISFNNVDGNGANGVHLKDTYSTTIIHNNISNHEYSELNQSAILLNNTSSNLIANNSIFNNNYGICLLNLADSNIINNNTIHNNQKYGIRLEQSSDNFFNYNKVFNNVLYGIMITFGSFDNVIQFNAFTGNHMGRTQATDGGANNTFSGNYWDDWSNPDADGDLIADIPYQIDGDANNSDPYPLVEFSIEAIENIKHLSPPITTAPLPNPYLEILFIFLIILTAVGGSIGLGYFIYRTRLNQRGIEFKFETEGPFTELISEKFIDLLIPLYHKLVVGLENIQMNSLPQPITVPLLEPAEPITLVEYVPSDIREDLWSGMKWRTVLTLIEIAYQDPSETNVVNLAKSLDIPRSTLSKEIKRLIDLHYIESLVTVKAMQDTRYRNYIITPRGFKTLYVLKEAFKLAIKRIKEKQADIYV